MELGDGGDVVNPDPTSSDFLVMQRAFVRGLVDSEK